MPEDIFWNLLAKKLAKEATPEELAHLEELMCQYPEWVYAARHIQDMWVLPSGNHHSESEKAFQQQLNKMNDKGVDTSPWLYDQLAINKTIPFYKKRWFIIVAAAFVAGLVSIVSLKIFSDNNHLSQNNLHSVSTHFGSKSKLMLPDGSTVWLNAGSKLSYDKNFGTNERHVTLDGEAFFDVVKMTDLPFVIQTKMIKIKVLGTTFNVKSYANEQTTETSLIKGKVEITINNRPEEKFMLLPDNKLIVSNEILEKNLVIKPTQTKKRIPLVALERLTYYEKDSTIVETSWKENRLVFQGESFEDIARKMERWYNVAFVFENQNLKAERLTGSFTSETITQALEALQIAADFKFRTDQNKIILTR
jgi:transmembrane sensor